MLESAEAVSEYLAGDRVECLICGRRFRGVGHHAARAHGLSASDYKRRFGLPQTRGVCSPDVSEAFRNVRRRTDTPERIAARVAVLHASDHPKGQHPPYAIKALTERAVRMRGREGKMGEAEYQRFLGAISAGATIAAACAVPGAARWTWIHDYIRSDPDRHAAFEALWESLPFSQQAASKKLGRRFSGVTAELRERGMTLAAIAAEIGVSEEAVRRRIVKMEKDQ